MQASLLSKLMYYDKQDLRVLQDVAIFEDGVLHSGRNLEVQ